MQNYHKHTSFSNVLVADCAASYEDYVNRALEIGQNVISSVEHGFQSNYYEPYELVQKHNDSLKKKLDNNEITQSQYEKQKLKFIFGAEAYWVKDRKKEYKYIDKKTGEYAVDKKGNFLYKKDRSNCHIVLLAKNEEGRRDINEALSDANIDGYYGQPRVDLELLLKIKPENVFITTACIAYWKYDDIEEITEKLHKHFGNNFYLEVQCHNTQAQKDLNKRILHLSKKYGIDIIFGYDSHFIFPEDSVERDNYVATRRKGYVKDEDDECGWFMDYPDETEVRRRLKEQGILNEEEIDRCINNTDLLLDFDDLFFDKEIKLPPSDINMTQEEKDKTLSDLVWKKWEEMKSTIPKERIKEYEDGIKYELNAIIDTHMADYFLIDNKIVKRGIEKGGIITKTGRGSGVSYYVNSLLGFSNIDRFISPVRLYPDRFMSKTRILLTRSLPDLDLNLGNPAIFAEAQDEVMTEILGTPNHAYPMISYKPLQVSSAFKLYAKSQNVPFEISNEITSQIKAYEDDLKHAETEEEKAAIDLYDYVDRRYHKHLDESKKYRGIINAKSQAPCGYLIYAGDIKREIGLIRCVPSNAKDESQSVITTVIDGMIAENYKFVKNDLLKVDIWLTINKIFEKVGIPTYTVPEMTKLVEHDDKTWNIYKNGYTVGINQCESDFGKQCSMKYSPRSMQELTALVAALRPGFKTQLQNFLNRKPYTTGVTELDSILEDSFHYIMYQENIMTYLGWLGISQTETYAIIKKISKKKFKEKELKELKERLIAGWIEKTGTEDGFEKTWEIIEASAKYSFNASHAYSYAYDSVYGAYLKANHPYEFYSVMMQHVIDKGDKKDKIIKYKQEMLQAFGIRNGEYKFGLDNRTFSIDKENKCINPSLASVKGFSKVTAEILYELGKKHYRSFLDVYLALREANISDNMIQLLIKISYFKDYGGIDYLTSVVNTIMQFYKNKKWGKQIKKDYALSHSLDFDMLRDFSGSETQKQFNDVNTKKLVSLLVNNIPNSKDSLKVIEQNKYEVLGNVDLINKKLSGYCMCTDLNTDYSPRLDLYAFANGNTVQCKIDKKIFKKNPIKRGDIIKVLSQYRKHKVKKVDGQWVETGEKEWWIDSYEVV